MKLYPNQIIVLKEILEKVVHKQSVLDHILKEHIEKNKRWGSRDRRNIYQAAYDMVRHYELLEYISKKTESDIIDIYSYYTLDGKFSLEKIKEDYSDIPFETLYSIPKEVKNIFEKENIHAEENIQAMHGIGEIYIRINTSLISTKDFVKKLNTAGIEYELIEKINLGDKTILLNCILLKQRTQAHKEFFDMHRDYFEFQDIGSQSLTSFINLDNTSQCIVESCAGNGGKTAHILDLTYQNQTLILSFDKSRRRLEELQNRVKKWNNHKVVTSLAKSKELEKYQNMADILYMDMPCTGSGTLKRQSDMKYRISEEAIKEKVRLQREIFHLFKPSLKEGGILIYSTCSLFHSENENQVEYITNNGFQLIEILKLEPKDYSGDGFFAAKFKKLE